MLDVRPERPADHDAARRVHQEAFGPGSPEAGLVDALRASGAAVPELCLVAVDDDEVVGHIVFSRATLGSGHEVLALAPMAVLPERQSQGIGSELVDESLLLAARSHFPLVVVLGHPGFYPRFGFEQAARYGVEAPWPVPPEAWMARVLPAYRDGARGVVTYAEAFDAVT
jgi:putative acetyltransferase